MATSVAQFTANRANAQKSTGAITQAGKAKVSQNALTHGLFAKQLVLADENPFEYQLLLEQLQHELLPVGVLEQSLVERVAISLWKQKRLLKAETAQLNLERQTQKIIDAVNDELNWSFTPRAITEQDLNEIDDEQVKNYKAILHEYEALDLGKSFDIAKIQAQFPTLFQELCIGAKLNSLTPEKYLQTHESATDFFKNVARHARDKLAKFERQQLVLVVAEMIKDKRAILSEKSRDSLAKYQVMLDNELGKALKSLREQQEWRVNSLQAIIKPL